MAYKNEDQCLKKAFDDEMLFVLMARDTEAPATVIEWIKRSLYTQPDDKLREALECALTMKRQLSEITYRKNIKTVPPAPNSDQDDLPF